MEEKEEDEDKIKKKKERLKEEEYDMTTGIIFTSVGEWCRGIIFASCLCCS